MLSVRQDPSPWTPADSAGPSCLSPRCLRWHQVPARWVSPTLRLNLMLDSQVGTGEGPIGDLSLFEKSQNLERLEGHPNT